jgi:hypothetical protein
MKKRPLFSLLTGSLLMFSGGCGFLPGGGEETDISAESQETAPPEVPLTSVRPLPPVDIAALGLIPPVLPNQRLREIQAGRPNPFALIPVEAKVTSPGSTADGSKATDGVSNGGENSGNFASSDGQTGVNGITSEPGQQNGSSIFPNSEPPRLYPDDARAVVVSGVIEIGSRPYAIVQAPGEPVARNVTVGDRLSGGKVIVKAINPFGATPNVVLEQYGDSVTREVGSPALPPLTPPPPGPPTMESPPPQTSAARADFVQEFAQILPTTTQ